MAIDLDHLHGTLARNQRRFAQVSGELEAEKRREAHLRQTVGEAKGRIAVKPKIDRFLEELQAEAHARRVGDFERLLTALVGEVMPGESPIGLELELDRGQPSLDIVSRLSADLNEDIWEDQGGALTNVIVLGLRMIAIARSGMRKFIALDESDCWIEITRVPAFYNVVKDAARKIGFQFLAISHHEIENFAEGIHVAQLSGHPKSDSGVHIDNGQRSYQWQDDEDGLRYIRLKNFQGYTDETLHLRPGGTALTGANNIGKSSLIRALRAVFYGETRDNLIKRGERQCVVEIGLKGGRTLRFDRQLRRNPINQWQLIGPDGQVVSEDQMVYSTGGRMTPEWVTSLIGIGPIEGHEAHIIKQKAPIFLLDKPGSTRASVLSIGQESGHLREMIRVHKQRVADDNTLIKNGEADMAGIMDRIALLESAMTLENDLTEAANALARIEKVERDNRKLEAVAERIAAARRSLEAASQKRALLETLPSPEEFNGLVNHLRATGEIERVSIRIDEARTGLERTVRKARILDGLPDAMPSVTPSGELLRVGRAIRDTRQAVSRAIERKVLLEDLPEMPVLAETAALARTADAIIAAKTALAQARTKSATLAEKAEAVEQNIAALVADLGNRCPLCGSGIEDTTVFTRDRHQTEGCDHA